MKRNGRRPKTAEQAFHEAVRLYHNGKGFLKNVVVEHGAYTDAKPVQEACAAAYLGLLRAIDGYLLARGRETEELPVSFQGYWDVLARSVPHNGKLRQAVKVAYQNLHVFGYYRGGVGVGMIKEGFEKARLVIELLTHRRL